MSAEFSVLVVSASERLQDALSRLLARQAGVVFQGVSRTASDALALFRVDPPDLVISDSPPAGVNDVLIWREVRDCGPRLLMLTNYLREGDSIRSVLAGASALILAPDARRRRLVEAVLRVAQGEFLIAEELIGRLRRVVNGEARRGLDEAERRVLSLILEGKRDREIASETAASLDEVRAYVTRLVEELVQQGWE